MIGGPIFILLGILGLGPLILIHELGHYFAARASGVEVEAFSIGWGPKVFSWKRGNTEWRISAIPLGGYCRMKGEEAFAAALQNKSETIPREPGTFYGAPAWKRILISAAGPLSNVLLALVLFIVVAAVGTTSKTMSNRIILASEFRSASDPLPSLTPAETAGLKTGDIVIQAGEKEVRDFTDLQNAIMRTPNQALPLRVMRDGKEVKLSVTPFLDKTTGAARIGIYSWQALLVDSVNPGSSAALAGLRSGDLVQSLDGRALAHTIELEKGLTGHPAQIRLGILREGAQTELTLVPNWSDKGPSLGLNFRPETKVTRSESLGKALEDGARATWSTIVDSVHSIGLLFKGVSLLTAISGPGQITETVGKVAVYAVSQNGLIGLMTVLDLLGLLSIALFIMNLLPIPALDGGMIVLFLVEIVKRSALKTKTVYRYQILGMGFVLGLLALALISDKIHFFPR